MSKKEKTELEKRLDAIAERLAKDNVITAEDIKKVL